jgi:hypothetical protein
MIEPEGTNQYLFQNVIGNLPFAAGKIGIAEFRAVREYLFCFGDSGLKNIQWSEESKKKLYANCGVFPEDDNARLNFVHTLIDSVKVMNALPVWSPTPSLEHAFIRSYSPACRLISVKELDPFYTAEPWTMGLQNKTVLVVSPFINTIEQQYAQRENIWRGYNMLPNFNLKTIKHPLSAGISQDSPYDSWAEMLEDMKRMISATSFDVALIGTGGSSLPLAVHCKSLGKIGIHLGGSLQILFGIRGYRWDKKPYINRFYNDYWVRPSGDEIPKNYKKLEDGCYW